MNKKLNWVQPQRQKQMEVCFEEIGQLQLAFFCLNFQN